MTESAVGVAAEPPASRPADELSPIRSPQSAIRNPPVWLTLLILIAMGGVLRFMYLDKPPIWYDEAATYARVSGTYQELLDALEEAGFGPLHYSLYWWIKNGLPTWGSIEPVRVPATVTGDGIPRTRRGAGADGKVNAHDLVPKFPIIKGGYVRMTPRMMRLVPAICGVLMIPAMFWLALELTNNRRAALFAAALTTFSAYLLNYSRDAKMYADLWLLTCVHVASLLWWLRTRKGVAWWSWIVAGSAMIGTQALGGIVLIIDLLLVLTARRANWKYNVSILVTPLLLIGGLFEWLVRAVWRSIVQRTLAVRQTVASWRMLPVLFHGYATPVLVPFLVGIALLLVGPYGYYVKFNDYTKRISTRGWQASGLHWVEVYNRGRTGGELFRYATTAFLTGWEWPRRSTDLLVLKDGTTVEGAGRTSGRNWRGTAIDGSAIEIPSADIQSIHTAQPDEKQISPRVLKTMKISCTIGAIVLLLGMLPWRWPWRKRAGEDPLTAPGRFTVADGWRRPLWIALWVALPPMGVYLVSQRTQSLAGPSTESIAAYVESMAVTRWSMEAAQWTRGRPFTAGAIGLIALLAFVFTAQDFRSRLRPAGRVLACFIVTFVICGLLRDVYPAIDNWLLKEMGRSWRDHHSLWIPRYLGIILPAVFVMAAVLIARLPTRGLRIAVMVFFMAVNLGQFSGRVFAGTEPPVDRMVQDTIEWRKSIQSTGADSPVRLYYNVPNVSMEAGLGPGTGLLGLPTSRYYWYVMQDLPSKPDEIRGMFGGGRNAAVFPRPPISAMHTSIRKDLSTAKRAEKLIVWEGANPGKLDPADKILDAIGPEWKRQSEEQFMARDHWTWRDYRAIRRRVYVKDPSYVAPATMPTTAPTTQDN